MKARFYLATAEFQPSQDMDGAAAAAYLRSKGYENVQHKDKGSYGEAWGTKGELLATLSTNGYFTVS